ncbi:MAG: sulfotransferase [Cyclobacteriaceae bacterium]
MRRKKLAQLLQFIAGLLPNKYPLYAGTVSTQPFFIMGSGRNGSTLLNRMLNAHSDLFVPSEQYFLGNSIIKYRIYNWLIWRDLMKIILGELMPGSKGHSWEYDVNPIVESIYLTKHRELQWVIDRIYRHCDPSQKKYWGDATPMNTYYHREVYDLFPRAKYIFLIRDGRDVVSSFKSGGKEIFEELSNVENSCVHWQSSLKAYQWLSKRTDVMLVKYEDLVAEPAEVLKQICSHIGVDYAAPMLDYHQQIPSLAFYQGAEHQSIRKPVFKDSVGNWKSVLNAEEQRYCNRVLHQGLQEFGYQS